MLETVYHQIIASLEKRTNPLLVEQCSCKLKVLGKHITEGHMKGKCERDRKCVWEKHLENNRGIGRRGIIYGSNTLTNSLTIFIEPN